MILKGGPKSEVPLQFWPVCAVVIPMRRSAQCRGFSLVELLVALSVLAIIAAIVVPRFIGVRDQASQLVMDANLKEISSAVQRWQDLGGTFNSGDVFAAFHLIQFLSQPGSASDPTRCIAAIDATNTCRDSGNSYTVSISAYAAPTRTTQPTSAMPDGYYGRCNTGVPAPNPDSNNRLYVKSGSKVYALDVQNNDLASAIFIRTGVALGLPDNPQTLP